MPIPQQNVNNMITVINAAEIAEEPRFLFIFYVSKLLNGIIRFGIAKSTDGEFFFNSAIGHFEISSVRFKSYEMPMFPNTRNGGSSTPHAVVENGVALI